MSSTSLCPYRILLVEDNDDHVWMFKRVMNQVAPDVELHVAGTGEAALRFLADPAGSIPDLIFLDINLGKLTGLQVLEKIKTDPGQIRRIPVIILTNSTSNIDILRAYDSYVAAYLAKPPENQELKKLLDSVIKLYEKAELPTRIQL